MLNLALLLFQAAAAAQPIDVDRQVSPVEVVQKEDRGLQSVLEDSPLVSRLAEPLRWGRIRFRERLISFTTYSARTASQALDGVLVDPAHRAAALMALGCSKAPGVRVSLESWSIGGGPLEQRAAVLALGELGGQSASFLLQMAESDTPAVAESALFAMLRLDSKVLRESVESIANDRTQANAALARGLIAFVEDPANVQAPDTVKLLFELRWDAALSYGLVAGKSRSQLRIEELKRNRDFLQTVVLRSTGKLLLAGVEDHLLALLKEGGREVVRIAVQRIPVTLGEQLERGDWKPANDNEWDELLKTIDEGGARRETQGLARAALKLPKYRLRAASLLMAMGDESAPALLRDALFNEDLETRIRVCRSFGRNTDSRWASELSKLRREPEPRLATAALVAQMRMGYEPADKVLRSIVLDGKPEQRMRLVEELLEVSGDSRVPPLLEAAYQHLLGRLRLRVGADLALRGRVLPRPELLAALESGTEPDLAATFVRGLSRLPSHNELQALARLFPMAGLEVNIELALALVDHHHAIGLTLLTGAMWTSPLDQSALAAGLLVQARGIGRLQQELDSPPTPVTQGDIRRVGFALGEWGGTEALEALAARRPSHDPALQGAYLGAMSARTQ